MLARSGAGTAPPADGWSFNLATDLPDDSFGEEGAGTGLTVSFDTYDNGAGEAPALDLKWGGAVIASVKTAAVINNDFVPVEILLTPDTAVLILTFPGIQDLCGQTDQSRQKWGGAWVDELGRGLAGWIPTMRMAARRILASRERGPEGPRGPRHEGAVLL